MEELEVEILKCNYCPFMEYEFNGTKELGFGAYYRILFIGSSPAITSNKSQGNSKFDKFFVELLAKVGIAKDDFYFTNLVKTSIPKGVIVTDEQSKHCFSHVLKEIAIVKPQLVVPLGTIAREPFGIRWPDSFVKKSISGKRMMVYPIAHPGTLHYHPEREQDYLRKLTKIFQHYKRNLI